jgi:cytidine deaminase
MAHELKKIQRITGAFSEGIDDLFEWCLIWQKQFVGTACGACRLQLSSFCAKLAEIFVYCFEQSAAILNIAIIPAT